MSTSTCGHKSKSIQVWIFGMQVLAKQIQVNLDLDSLTALGGLATTNVIHYGLMKHLKLKDFKLSQVRVSASPLCTSADPHYVNFCGPISSGTSTLQTGYLSLPSLPLASRNLSLRHWCSSRCTAALLCPCPLVAHPLVLVVSSLLRAQSALFACPFLSGASVY